MTVDRQKNEIKKVTETAKQNQESSEAVDKVHEQYAEKMATIQAMSLETIDKAKTDWLTELKDSADNLL